MDYKEALNLVISSSFDQLVYRNNSGIEYAPAVDALVMACLDDFDMEIYQNYVTEAKFRPELLELKEGKKSPKEFSKKDLQLFLVIQEKAEQVMAGQLAAIIENSILITVARQIKNKE